MHIGILPDNSTLTWNYHWKNLSVSNKDQSGIVGHAVPSATNTFDIYSFDEAGQSEFLHFTAEDCESVWQLNGLLFADTTISVVGTQYNEFLILWQCQNENATHFTEEVFVFSRFPSLNNSVDGIIDLFSNSSKLHAVEQGEEL